MSLSFVSLNLMRKHPTSITTPPLKHTSMPNSSNPLIGQTLLTHDQQVTLALSCAKTQVLSDASANVLKVPTWSDAVWNRNRNRRVNGWSFSLQFAGHKSRPERSPQECIFHTRTIQCGCPMDYPYEFWSLQVKNCAVFAVFNNLDIFWRFFKTL